MTHRLLGFCMTLTCSQRRGASVLPTALPAVWSFSPGEERCARRSLPPGGEGPLLRVASLPPKVARVSPAGAGQTPSAFCTLSAAPVAGTPPCSKPSRAPGLQKQSPPAPPGAARCAPPLHTTLFLPHSSCGPPGLTSPFPAVTPLAAVSAVLPSMIQVCAVV